MNNSSYINRTQRKMESVLNYYALKMFKTIARAENVTALETMEHLRTPPAPSDMRPISVGDTWGREYGSIWLSCDITVPDEADGMLFGAIPDTDAREVLCFRDGKPVGIINSKNSFIGGRHSCMIITKEAHAGEKFSLSFECYAGHTELGTAPYDSYTKDENAADSFEHTYEGVRIVVLDKIIEKFVFDLSTVLQIAKLPPENYTAMKANLALKAAFPYLIQDIRFASEEEIHESCEKVCECLAPALEKNGGESSRGYLGVIGHSHMDTAWLWPVSETIRKCARTYSEALTLMDIYPNYKFIQSSALHLDWMREYYPSIFEEIRKRVAEGRYEPNGGVWVECDCNVTGGEAMVRQFLYGQRFTEKYLNYRSDTFWLPDTFGYNGAIPQIMRKSGVKYFYTTKMSWNDLNRFPADTFIWRGIDGSEVITHLNKSHFTPNVESLNNAIKDNCDKSSCDMRLGSYGYGDGGGGPTLDMLELLDRAEGLEGMPVIEETTVSEFMQKLEEKREQLPLFDGELYLELHRGTLTQMHEVKKHNRKAEIALHDFELLNVLSGEETNERHDEYYKVLLKNQFHDILPGTCIRKVYEEEIPEMDRLISNVKAESTRYLSLSTKTDSGRLSVVNTLPFDRCDAITVDGECGIEGRAAQVYTDYNGEKKTVFTAQIPAMSSIVFTKTAAKDNDSAFKTDGNELKTPFYRVKFDENGYISSLYDIQADREVRNQTGAPLGTLWLGEDMPRSYDNWDIDDDIFLKLRPVTSLVSSEVVSDGAVEYRVRSTYKLGKKSTACIDTVFYSGSRRIDYDVKLDWQERHALLKAGFDVNIRSAFVKNEIQFGHIDRPTTRNNTIEEAKFEVCNQKWSDMSETHYGVAILNDCKYGMSAEGSDMRLTLHKGGARPDPFTEKGIHTMKYALLPHMGSFDAERVVRPAYEFNYDPIVVGGECTLPSLFSLSSAGIICEAVKKAEDDESAYVLRLYEAERNHTSCRLKLSGAKRAYLTNMLEEKEEELEIIGGEVALRFTPFEIKTVLVER